MSLSATGESIRASAIWGSCDERIRERRAPDLRRRAAFEGPEALSVVHFHLVQHHRPGPFDVQGRFWRARCVARRARAFPAYAGT
jgi:hypothetical protein